MPPGPASPQPEPEPFSSERFQTMADDRRTRLSQRIPRALRWTLIILGGLLLLVVGAAVILPLVLPSEQIEALVVPRMEAALDREVEVESAGLRVLPLPALRLYDFQVANAEGFGPEPAIEGAALDVRLELLSLFQGDVRFQSIELDRPVIRYAVDAEGRSNFEGLGGAEEAAQDTTPAGALPLAVAISNFSAEEATLSYVDQQSSQSAEITFDVTTTVFPVPETDHLQSEGTVDLRSGWMLQAGAEDTLSVGEARLAYDLRAEPDEERLAVNRLTLDGASLGIAASGAITDLGEDPTLDLQVESDEIDLARLSALQGDASETGTAPSGNVRFALQITGPAASPDRLTIDGPVTLSEIRYPMASFREPITIPSAELRFAGQQLTADAIPIQLGENTLAFDLEVQDLFAPFAAEAEDGALPTAQFALTSERLDLRNLYVETDEPGYSELVVAQLAGQQIDGQDPSVIAAEQYGAFGPPPIEAHGQVAINALITESQQLDDLSLQMDLTPQQLAIRDLSAATYDGTLAGDLSVNLQSQEPPFPMEYAFALEDITAAAFARQWTALGAFLGGSLDVSLTGGSTFGEELLPATPTLQADGRAIATSGQFQDLALIDAILERLPIDVESIASFERFGGPFEIREGQLLIPGWTLQTSALSGELEGALGLDGAVALDLTLSMPLELLQQSGLVDEIGGAPARLLGRLAGEDETVQVPIEIGGTMRAPRVQVDRKAIASALRRMIGATDTRRSGPVNRPRGAASN